MNLANVSTLIFISTLIFLHEVFTTAAFLYLALYTSYVCCWLIKHYLFPNPRFESDLKMLDLVCSVPILFGAYWALPFMAIVWAKDMPLANYQIFSSVVCFVIGLTTMMVSDAENYYLLMHSPDDIGKLGLTRLIVAPNMIGESFLYTSFAVLTQSPPILLLLIGVWIVLFNPINNMKANSLVHYLQKWELWKRQTGMYLPDLNHVRVALGNHIPTRYNPDSTNSSPQTSQSVKLEEESTDATESPVKDDDEEEDDMEDVSEGNNELSSTTLYVKSHVPFEDVSQQELKEEEEEESMVMPSTKKMPSRRVKDKDV